MASLRAFEYFFLSTKAHVESITPAAIDTKINIAAVLKIVSASSPRNIANNKKIDPINGDIHANIV